MSELRWHPFQRTWVITATHRQDRTYHPPPDFCPLCPTKPGGFPTEITLETYDIVVFENKFPSLRTPAAEVAVEGSDLMPERPSEGACEVVCYSQEHHASLATLPLEQVCKLTRVWKDRYLDLCSRPEVEYVFIFENKGKEIGVTLSHPHGQIYGYPYIPAVLSTELAAESKHFAQSESSLMDDWLREELQGPRTLEFNESFAAVVPYFARYPYEVWIAPLRPIRSLADCDPSELDHFSAILHSTVRRYDLLFGFSLPYIMAIHQKPAKGDWPFTRLHVEFYPPNRTESKLKYLAGSEAGAGAYINDTLPEETAKRLREIPV
ncbi:MAG: Galactose-1-phosphate uridylyltransferase [Fimbriimonadaceae bacterium]|nr:Galactose-1-phosphate uridylyltransferase [Fimbriimonadaceae bacterium]